jgi:hypothetical protein
MSQLSDQIRAALDKKKGITHPDANDTPAVVEKTAKTRTQPPQGKKPPTRSAGRGR